MTQADLFTGAALKVHGQDQVEHTGREFIEWARAHAREICRFRGTVTTDDLRSASEQCGIRPHHQNAWGSVFRGYEWEPVGYRRSRLASNHARRITVWRWRNEGSKP